MTQSQLDAYKNSPEYHSWSRLRRKALAGETLTEQEQAAYEATQQQLDAAETALLFNIYSSEAATLRAEIAESEAEIELLRARRSELAARIRSLEALLDEPTRQALFPSAKTTAV